MDILDVLVNIEILPSMKNTFNLFKDGKAEIAILKSKKKINTRAKIIETSGYFEIKIKK